MCGLSGFVDTSLQRNAQALQSVAARMSDCLRHRGPDDEGVWTDPAAGVALGFRRLSILDLSAAGHQPMISESGRYVIVFNGEIYNSPQLKPRMKALGSRFRGESDTEVMLAAFEHWGVRRTLEEMNGMFAFALWDREKRELHLSRDRLGEKPLYYGWMGNTFLFGSELKALRAHPDFRAEINRDSIALLLRHNCIPAPYSIYQGIRKLPPASLLTLKPESRSEDMWQYWSLRAAAEEGTAHPFSGSEEDAADRLEELLRDSVKMRMLSDVPLGAFLSGGIDSSTIVALMQHLSNRPVRTFTIGLTESGYNEADDAKAVARHLRTEHTELYVTSSEAMSVIPKLPAMYDEPFSDSSQIPTYLVSQMARQHVTVGLSGDGGDEFFGGYNRYIWSGRVWKAVGWLPSAMRGAVAKALTSLSPAAWDSLFRSSSKVLPSKFRQRIPGDKLHKLAAALKAAGPREMYLLLASHWDPPDAVVLGSQEPMTLVTSRSAQPELPSHVQQMMYLDAVTYLPDDILVKLDRASMAVSLEARVPFLDHRVVEFAWSLPMEMKIRQGQSKSLLRQVLYRHVPAGLIERPKMGFGVPIEGWLRGPLRHWAEELLDEGRLKREGYFDVRRVRQKWEEHLSGKRNWQHHLWDVLMFQQWKEAQPASKENVQAAS